MVLPSAGGEKAMKVCGRIDRICSAVITVIMILMFALLLVYATLEPVLISGSSMENSYHDGSTVLIDKVFSEAERGDVVVVEHGDGNLIKRVVAVGGDRVGFVKNSDGTIELYLDSGSGYEKVAEPYIKEAMRVSSEVSVFGEIKPKMSVAELESGGYEISEGCVFALGDNRNVSLDSRKYGEFREDDIVGTVLTVIKPDSFLDGMISLLYREASTDNN